MSTLICGSMAYDTIMVFQDRFKNHILPDQVHILNVSFHVPEMRREFGGCAGNIAYSLRLLGGRPLPMATAGPTMTLPNLPRIGCLTPHSAAMARTRGSDRSPVLALAAAALVSSCGRYRAFCGAVSRRAGCQTRPAQRLADESPSPSRVSRWPR